MTKNLKNHKIGNLKNPEQNINILLIYNSPEQDFEFDNNFSERSYR